MKESVYNALINKSTTHNRVLVWRLTLTADLGIFVTGYIVGVLNNLQSYIEQSVFEWNSHDAALYEGFLNSAVAAGGSIGALLGGSFAKYIGRRKSMMLADLIVIIGSILTTLPYFPVFLIGRSFTGFSAGINCSVIPLYLNEVVPLQLRGPTGSSIQTSSSIGTLLALGLAFWIPIDGTETSWWRVMLGIPAIVGFVRFMLLFAVHTEETPKYLVSVNQQEEAKNVMKKIYTENYIQEHFDSFLEEIKDEGALDLGYRKLLSKRWRYRFFIGITVAIGAQLTGISGLLYYSTKVFSNASAAQITAEILTCAMVVLGLISNMSAGYILLKVGRKIILLIGSLGMGVCWAILGLSLDFNYTVWGYISIFVSYAIFNLSFGVVTWIFLAEVLPPVGVGFSFFLNWVMSTGVIQIFPLLMQSFPNTVFFIFASFCWLLFFVVLLFLKETKDKTSKEIAEIYYGSSFSSIQDYENKDDSSNLQIDVSAVVRSP